MPPEENLFGNDWWFEFTNDSEELLKNMIGFMDELYTTIETEPSQPSIIEGNERNVCSKKPSN